MTDVQNLLITMGIAAAVCLVFGTLIWAYCCVLYGNPNKCDCKKISKPIGQIEEVLEDEDGLSWTAQLYDNGDQDYRYGTK